MGIYGLLDDSSSFQEEGPSIWRISYSIRDPKSLFWPSTRIEHSLRFRSLTGTISFRVSRFSLEELKDIAFCDSWEWYVYEFFMGFEEEGISYILNFWVKKKGSVLIWGE